MNLTDLGFDTWFEERAEEALHRGLALARVSRVDRERYLVLGEPGEVAAEATGKLLYSAETGEGLPCVGDWVSVQYYDNGTLAIIHNVLPRKSFLRRKRAGSKAEYQMIAANLDTAFIMQSCDRDFNLRRMERYLVIAAEGGVEPHILLSKSDLLPDPDVATLIESIRNDTISAPVISFSNTTGAGIGALTALLTRARTYCLLGSSGVGKTTLLNTLLGEDTFATQPVRDNDSRGRHTTTRRELSILANGALLIDTPGLRELGLMGVSSTIDSAFPEIHELAKGCRYGDCTHTVEAGCAVRNAVETGALDEARYLSYLKLEKESAFHEMSYVERRKKDRAFGRMVKNALNETRKRKR